MRFRLRGLKLVLPTGKVLLTFSGILFFCSACIDSGLESTVR